MLHLIPAIASVGTLRRARKRNPETPKTLKFRNVPYMIIGTPIRFKVYSSVKA